MSNVNPNKLEWHCEVDSLEHKCLCRLGWTEDYCFAVDDEVWVKLSKPRKFSDNRQSSPLWN